MCSDPDILFYQAVQESKPSKNDHGNFKIYINYSNFINFTGMIWTSQGFLDGDMVSSDTGILILKFMLQSQLMLFVDYIMANMQDIRLTKIVGSVPYVASTLNPLIVRKILTASQ